MSIARAVNVALGASMLLASCGDDQALPADGGPCWPLKASPGGEVQLGTGQIAFQPMPDTLAVVINGSQSDPFLEVHARIRGFPPGDPDNAFDPHNPKTKVSATIEALNLALGVECPASLGYVAGPESGTYDMVHSLRIGLGLLPLGQVSGQQARITVEVVGSNSRTARDEKLVTLMVP
ncbi:MAG TPA: hypothetical protein VN253_06170 [Kofleriaceae bacterium]|nr:hypothetical protein [Kofleriaceae bacterium]